MTFSHLFFDPNHKDWKIYSIGLALKDGSTAKIYFLCHPNDVDELYKKYLTFLELSGTNHIDKIIYPQLEPNMPTDWITAYDDFKTNIESIMNASKEAQQKFRNMFKDETH